LFEEAGEIAGCLGVGKMDPEEYVRYLSDIGRARDHIESARKAMKAAGEASARSSEAMEAAAQRLVDSMRKKAAESKPVEMHFELKAGKSWKLPSHWPSREVKWVWPDQPYRIYSASPETGTATTDGPSPALTSSQKRALRKFSTRVTSASGPDPMAESISKGFERAWSAINKRSGSYPETTRTTHRSWTRKIQPGGLTGKS
jgi:hypothetical protein